MRKRKAEKCREGGGKGGERGSAGGRTGELWERMRAVFARRNRGGCYEVTMVTAGF